MAGRMAANFVSGCCFVVVCICWFFVVVGFVGVFWQRSGEGEESLRKVSLLYI